MKGLITICARGGSKGVKNKNIKEVNGIPLIVYTIDIAKNFSKHNKCDIALSTNSLKIKKIAEKNGLFSKYLRPKHLSNDIVGKIYAIKDILEFSEDENTISYDYVLDLDISSPLRTLEDLNRAFHVFKKNNDCLNLFSVSKAHKNPYFNMVEVNENGFCNLCKNLGLVNNRQEAPKVYELNASFYFYKRIYFNSAFPKVITEKSLIYEQKNLSFDIDNQIDLDFLQFLMENDRLTFEI